MRVLGSRTLPLRQGSLRAVVPTLSPASALPLPAGREPASTLGLIVGVGLALLLLVLLAYAFIRWYQTGRCWHRPDFVFNLYHIRGLRAVEVELAPPFTVSGSLSEARSGYVRFHDRGL
nr:small integral membrane protein 35 isoform X1 [Dromaius novaehollandiae]XP_025970200.1 small integral membrane protein 35 isoform X1 [Dromaius novaehollandiae]XP_025970201.1 small integral membrane protein 35 isoform X1 [Dromaius novaehollandiae]